VLHCPFCGAAESDRIDLDGDRFLVFECMFTPQVDPSLPDDRLEEHLRRTYEGSSAQYFRSMCDRMHLFVTKGAGASTLLSRSGALRSSSTRDGASSA
jgi:hypothetical protein